MAGTIIVMGTISVVLSNPGATALLAGVYLFGKFCEDNLKGTK